MDSEDSAFIQRVIKYVATLDKNNEKNMQVHSNTRLPRRFLFTIKKIPVVSIDELYKIECMNTNLKEMEIDLYNGFVKVDVWRKKCSERGKRKRSSSPRDLSQHRSGSWDLEGLREEDRKACRGILDSITEMPSIMCQFKVDIEEDPPDHYILKLYIKDTVMYSNFKSLKLDYRAFIDSIEFNFHEKSILIIVKRIT